MCFEQIVQDLMNRFQRNGSPEQVGVGDETVQRAFELSHVGGDLVGQIFQYLRRYRPACPSGFGFQDGKTQLVGGGMKIGDHTATEACFQPVFEREIGGRFIGRNDNLFAGFHQIIESMEEFFLSVVLADKKL